LNLEDIGDTSSSQIGFLSTVINRVEAETATVASFGVDAISPLNFGVVVFNRVVSTSGSANTTYPIHVDMTDGAGNGFLVATDRMFIYGAGVGNAVAGRYTAKILYRLIEVGITEYVGIVGGQQG